MKNRYPYSWANAWLAGVMALGPMNPLHAGDTASAAQVAEARGFLKEHLKSLNQSYPFGSWSAQLEKARQAVDALQALAGERPVNRTAAARFRSLDRDLEVLRAHRPEVQKLINEMYVQVVAFRIEEKFQKQGKVFSSEAREEFTGKLKPFEAGSLRPKTSFLAGLAALETRYAALRTDWMIAYAEGLLAQRIGAHLKSFDLQKNESLYDGYNLQLDYWRGQIASNALQAREELQKLGQKWLADKTSVQENLSKLTEALNADMLYSDLLATAQNDGVDFSLAVEEHIEAQLQARQADLRSPLERRKVAWNQFQADLKSLMAQATEAGETQQVRQIEQAEQERQERARLEALRAEQERHEQEQKEKFKETVNALKTFTFKNETSVSLDDHASKALDARSGFLKSSYVGTGKVKLKVGKEKFSDTLAFVNRFDMAEGSVDLSKMSLDEKTSQSAYVYTSPQGRTSQQDLERFVELVALGSFSTGFNFFSYVPDGKWRPESRLRWRHDKASAQGAQDRNFSYVDLVVDAHRKRSGTMQAGESRQVIRSVNVPANMIIFFDSQGGIKRFLSFADISEITVRAQDMTGGKLYYKFLNYSTDRNNIYLNGIDPEIKVSQPNA